MRKFAVLLAALTFGGSTFAADMAAKAPQSPVPLPAPAYSWNSCYLGANGGYAWNSGKNFYQDSNGIPDPINGLSPNTIPLPAHTIGNAWTGGGEVGCNWQINSGAVVGIEADIDALHASGSASTVLPGGATLFIGPGINGGGPFLSPSTANEQATLHWLSTLRPRVGMPVLANRGLLFVSGGLAIGRVSTSGSVNTFFDPPVGTPYVTWGGSTSVTRYGFAVGGGFEYELADHWTAKAEYLYYDLGDAKHPLNQMTNNCCAGAFATLGDTATPVHGSIMRLGLNYQFGWTQGR